MNPPPASPPDRAKPKGAYHHGDLKRTLVDSAVELARQRGPAGFTLAEICRGAGVSTAAPYRHYESKEHILAEAAEEGFALLSAHIAAALVGPPDFEATAVRLARGYLAFAREHPGYLAVMFKSFGDHLFGGAAAEISGVEQLCRLPEPSSLSEAALVDAWRAGQAALMQLAAGLVAATSGTPLAARTAADGGLHLACAFWAMIHGVATLSAERMLAPVWVAEPCDAVIDWMVRPWTRGLLAEDPRSA